MYLMYVYSLDLLVITVMHDIMLHSYCAVIIILKKLSDILHVHTH